VIPPASLLNAHSSPGRLGLLFSLLLCIATMHASEPDHVLFPAQGTNTVQWQIVNDDVMGGVSRSRVELNTNGVAIFQGDVSLANNGGFASVRTAPTRWDLSRFDAFVIRVRGDGQRYKFTARTEAGFDSALYQTTFVTRAGEWTEHRFRFSELAPTFRGRVLTDAPKFNPAQATSFGFLISDRQEGKFRLEIESVRATTTPR
jgi:monofunctional biosynthetic peptidoglycan transglycosylase